MASAHMCGKSDAAVSTVAFLGTPVCSFARPGPCKDPLSSSLVAHVLQDVAGCASVARHIRDGCPVQSRVLSQI